MALWISYGMSGNWSKTRLPTSKYLFVDADNTEYYWNAHGYYRTVEYIHYITMDQLATRKTRKGYDILLDNPTDDQIVECYPKRGKNVCAFLLDGTFDGIGNYIKCMILHTTRVSPHSNTKGLTRAQKIALFREARWICNVVVAMGGHTIRDFKSDDGRQLGTYDTTPYGSTTDSHGNSVVKEKIGGRSTYWCPAVQVLY